MDEERHDPTDLGLPDDLESGVYASVLATWYSQHEFTLDFAAPATQDVFRVTARVRMPPTAIFQALRELSAQIGSYELDFGEIHVPRRPT